LSQPLRTNQRVIELRERFQKAIEDKSKKNRKQGISTHLKARKILEELYLLRKRS